ncbi:hypothetical protein [Mesorhizobium sp. M8A.F.Ca.ET.021.01.1.1]|uniref:hypothetical protein n=1 Tax=Mesorhizobium sp. M8A.F.Ca.ET.021.01.1.1 TaxID=2496757 RepID=UPI000FCABD32|nr:hypothetical protein [Mesorhizobium sp. M8A.F.Ca.ET.021.01.1.1]RUW57127.1 hypothetical protein EOA36_00660 [Mesorhizobium sp. M8A.F.Ca.ET.021.01.1.1]
MAWQEQDYPHDLLAEGDQQRKALARTAGTQVWVTTGCTESGDAIGPYVWAFKPTDEQVERRLRTDYPEEYEEVGFVNSITAATTMTEH